MYTRPPENQKGMRPIHRSFIHLINTNLALSDRYRLDAGHTSGDKLNLVLAFTELGVESSGSWPSTGITCREGGVSTPSPPYLGAREGLSKLSQGHRHAGKA